MTIINHFHHDCDKSRDYTKLFEKAHTSSIICLVDFRYEDSPPLRDVGRTTFKPDFPEYSIGVRGLEYVTAFTFDEFRDQCHKLNVEWIVPKSEASRDKDETIRFLREALKRMPVDHLDEALEQMKDWSDSSPTLTAEAMKIKQGI